MTKRLKAQLGLLGGLAIVLIICNFFAAGRLFTTENIRTIATHAVFPTFAAWGMCFIFSCGLIDLSIGANILLSANVGVLLANMGAGYVGLILGAVVCAVVCVQLSAHCSITLGIPAWVSGLGVALILEAILSQWSNYVAAAYAERLPVMNQYRALGKMPGAIILLFVGLVAAYIIFNKTTLGMNLQAVGGNAKVSESMGIKVRKTIILSTVAGGIFVGFAAINDISFAGKLDCTSGLSSLNIIFKSLAATLLADSIENIFTKPVGIFIASMAVAALFNILTLFSVPSGTGQNICLGAVVIFCGILSHLNYKEVVK